MAQQRYTYAFIDTFSWLDVGLQVLMSVGWRPAGSQAQTIDVLRSIPPDPFASHFFTDRVSRPHDRETIREGVRTIANRTHITAGVVRVGEIYATITGVQDENGVLFCSGYVTARNILAEPPAYIQEGVD